MRYKNIYKRFIPLAKIISKPKYLEDSLEYLDYKLTPEEYVAFSIAMMFYSFLFLQTLSFLFFLLFKQPLLLLIPAITSVFVFFYLVSYPLRKMKEKIADIEKNLLFGLRSLLIQVKGGLTLYSALNTVAKSKKYGELSNEIKKIIDRINTGYSEMEALQEMIRKTRSPYFRNALWYLYTALDSGADVTEALETTIKDLESERKRMLEKFSGELRLMSLLYVLIGAVFPALGLTLFLILSLMPQIGITKEFFYLILLIIGGSEFIYLTILRNKRSNLIQVS